jgi:DNA-binding NtrC family response regulator
MKIGAVDFVQKPFEIEEMELKIEKAIELRPPQVPGRVPAPRAAGHLRLRPHRRRERRAAAVLTIVKKVARSNSTILIRGETGTGKELIAGAIHHNSNRANRAFVKVNCAALQENLLESELFGHEKGAFTSADKQRIGRFEQADGGTLFLDEVGDMSPSTQAKILRVLPGARVRAAGRHAHAARRRPHHRGDQPQPHADGAGGPVPRGPVLPAERRVGRDAAAARPQGRHRALAEFFVRRFSGELKKKVDGIDPDAMKC